jgi:hypothetical protein
MLKDLSQSVVWSVPIVLAVRFNLPQNHGILAVTIGGENA